ncbi:MAG: molybdenum ABC transporter ATP-binding protein [Gammaproteobacteria bacterium]|nr:molybdenum ABC transporter ATP-binding protein [Gammaproteobacteria bacterium]
MSLSINCKIQRGEFELCADIALPERGITVLYGESGCGKTSLLRAIAGLDRHADTRIMFADQVWQDEAVFVAPYQRRIGYVFQEASLFSHLSVAQNIDYGRSRSAAAMHTPLAEIIRLLGLETKLDQRPEQLSGGERRRVAIARALASAPQILLMDEPLVSLDHARRMELMSYLEQVAMQSGLPMVYVSHAQDEVARLAHHVVMLQGGRVSGSGHAADVLTDLALAPAASPDAVSVVEGVLLEHDQQYGLSRVEFAGGVFSIPASPRAVGDKLRIQVAARDVSLALQAPEASSILNVFAARVVAIQGYDRSQVTVKLDCGGSALLARVTRKSMDRLKIAIGTQLMAQIKSTATLA